jgi:hypothetical protein
VCYPVTRLLALPSRSAASVRWKAQRLRQTTPVAGTNGEAYSKKAQALKQSLLIARSSARSLL